MKNTMYFFLIMPLFLWNCEKKSKLNSVPEWQECYESENEARRGFMNFPIGAAKKGIVQGIGVLNCRGSHRIFVFYEEKNIWQEIILPADLRQYYVHDIQVDNLGFRATFWKWGNSIYYYFYSTGKWIMVKEKPSESEPEEPKPQKITDNIKPSPLRALLFRVDEISTVDTKNAGLKIFI